MNILSLIGSIFAPATKLVDAMHTSEEEKLTVKVKLFELQTKLFSQISAYETKLLEAKSTIITAEAQSQSVLARNWRPATMIAFVVAILAHWFGWTPDTLTDVQVESMYQLVKIGIGGYVAGRSLEKIADKITLKMKPE